MITGPSIALSSDLKCVRSLYMSSSEFRSFHSRPTNSGRIKAIGIQFTRVCQSRYRNRYSYDQEFPKDVSIQLYQSHNWSEEVPPKLPMTDKWKPRKLAVYLYAPNIVGYIRVLMNCFAFYICFSNRKLFSILYFISFVCDALDGWFARKFNQASTFGAVLDMVTDRISTACLLVILSQVYRPSLVFLSLLALDIASHWLQMYSTFLVGKGSHKDVKDSSNWLFKAYYGNRMFMGYCCVACEVLYIMLFLLAKDKNESLVNVFVKVAVHPVLFALLVLLIAGWGIKQAINVIQMKIAADLCVDYDINKKQKA